LTACVVALPVAQGRPAQPSATKPAETKPDDARTARLKSDAVKDIETMQEFT
jgi:hypothetical protein